MSVVGMIKKDVQLYEALHIICSIRIHNFSHVSSQSSSIS